MRAFLHSLSETLSQEDFGSKAAGLSMIRRAQLLIPNGSAISRHAHELHLNKGSFPPQLADEINNLTTQLKSGKLIVRSSAIGEDGEDFSFAGQLDSFVVDNKTESVIKGIQDCWNSIANERVKAYQGFAGKKLKHMGVVIQEFIEADYSGVVFTQSPFRKDLTYTEYVKGSAAPLVSGEVTPSFFSTDKNFDIPEDTVPPFDHKLLLESVRQLQPSFKMNLDIEWLCKKGIFYFVQARPVKKDEREKVYWTNTNLNENYPDPVSPLLYSIARDSYYHYFKNLARIVMLNDKSIRLLEYDFSNTVGIFGNRIYYNMTSIHNILDASPYHAYFRDAFNRFVGYPVENASSGKRYKKPKLFRLLSRLVYLNICLPRHVKKINKYVAEYAAGTAGAESLKDLSRCFYGFLDLRFNQWYHAGLADLFSMVHYKGLSFFLKRFDNAANTNSLIMAIPGLITNKPLADSREILSEIEKIPGGREFFAGSDARLVLDRIEKDEGWKAVKLLIDCYMQRWGFRCSGELEFETENYIDAPWKYIELLKTYMVTNRDNQEDSFSKLEGEKKIALKKTIKAIFRKRKLLLPLSVIESFILLLLSRLCRSAIYKRESVRYSQALMYYSFRKIIYKTGSAFSQKGIIESERDILFLTYKEIGYLLSSSDMFPSSYKEIISIRKKRYEEESILKFPSTFETFFGESHSNPGIFTENAGVGNELSGLAASGGKIRNKVKILKSVFEASKINPGEILVARQTDPGWAMLFPVIGGLVVERGGALSHCSIVAREYGIPCVTGIEGITEVLRDNDEIILDGDLGKIYIL